MKLAPRQRQALLLGLLAVLPVVAHAPGLLQGRLLGPGDGAALHLPLRAAVWESYRNAEGVPSWDASAFCGTPLLASYRSGAFFPPMVIASLLPPFLAFQTLVLFSLSSSAILVYRYLHRLGAHPVGAYLSGLSFALGPYMVGHLHDTATVVAAPTLPLLLLAAEAHVRKSTPGRAAGLAAGVALLLLAGSPEAVRAGAALLAGRLVIAILFPLGDRRSMIRTTAIALSIGLLLAAPQLIPTLIQAREAGRQVTGFAPTGAPALPGATGLILRYVSHTPAPSLALAALPLALTETPVRVLGVALALGLGLQWGRGPLSAPGALALVFDLTLALLAGLSLSAQWKARRNALGGRLRIYFLFACLASAAALSISAAALGPLPQQLASAVGILAVSLILYFSFAESDNLVAAGIWLLPLTAAFVLQPHGRRIWADAPSRQALERGTPTREAIERAMGQRRRERTLTLARAWPREEAVDLAFGGLGIIAGRRSAGGYDPMVSMRTRAAFDGMGVAGLLSGGFFRSDPTRLEAFGIRWFQVPTSALTARPDRFGLGDTLDLQLDVGRPRFFPLPLTRVQEIHLASFMSEAVAVPHDQAVAQLTLRLVSGHRIDLPLRAGVHTGEWAYDRSDVRPIVAHGRPPVLESWTAGDGSFEGHRYRAILRLPGRYLADGLRIERLPGPGALTLSRLLIVDQESGQNVPVSLVAGFVSDATRFRETAATPAVRLFEVTRSAGEARVVDSLRRLPDDEAVLRTLRTGGWDPRREALAVVPDVSGIALPDGSHASRVEIRRPAARRIEALAEGPGLLVMAEGWDPGWTASINDRPAAIVRVNHIQMGLVLEAGFHRIRFQHRARGLAAGWGLAALGALGLLALAWRGRRI